MRAYNIGEEKRCKMMREFKQLWIFIRIYLEQIKISKIRIARDQLQPFPRQTKIW